MIKPNKIINIHSNQDNIEGAIGLYEEFLQIQRTIGEQQGIASTSPRIGSPGADTVAQVLQVVRGMR
jgi:hypothetical protein